MTIKKVKPFHKALAKLVAKGVRNKEICESMGICQSRLSVLKGNPLFQNVVKHYEEIEEDAYKKAQLKLEESAYEVATELAEIATDKDNVPANIRASTGFGILDRVGLSKGNSRQADGKGGEQIVFEKMLRITKTAMTGSEEEKEEAEQSEEYAQALRELEEIQPEDDEVIDITPIDKGGDMTEFEKMVQSGEVEG